MQETQIWSLGQGDPLEEEMAIHSNILAWKIPWTEEPNRLQFKWLQRVSCICLHIQLITYAYDRAFFFNFTILYWFCHIPTWIGHRYTHVRILNPPPSSFPVPSLWVIPVHQPQASSIVHWTWTGDSFHIWYFLLSLNLAIRSSWSEPQSAPGLVFADCIEFLHLWMQRI